MNAVHFIVNMLNCKHHIELGPGDSVSIIAVYGAIKVNCSCSVELFKCDKKGILAHFDVIYHDVHS